MNQLLELRFRTIHRGYAITVLTLLVLCTLGILSFGIQNPDCKPTLLYFPEADSDPLYGDDSHFYHRIIQQVRQGYGYYDVANIELRQHGFKPNSIFNWRLPTYAWFIGSFSNPGFANAILVGLSIIALILAFLSEIKRIPLFLATACVCIIFGVFRIFYTVPLPEFGMTRAALFQEPWAAVFITISVASYGLGWNLVGVLAGVSALFWRELALPFCVVAFGLAIWRKEKREWIAWSVGLVAFTIFYLSHVLQINGKLLETPFEGAKASTWIAFSGLRFHFVAMNVNEWMSGRQAWLMAFFIALSFIGFSGWSGKQGVLVGLSATAYLLIFSVVGRTTNGYWGYVYATLLPFGFVRSPMVLMNLWMRVIRKEAQ